MPDSPAPHVRRRLRSARGGRALLVLAVGLTLWSLRSRRVVRTADREAAA